MPRGHPGAWAGTTWEGPWSPPSTLEGLGGGGLGLGLVGGAPAPGGREPPLRAPCCSRG